MLGPGRRVSRLTAITRKSRRRSESRHAEGRPRCSRANRRARAENKKEEKNGWQGDKDGESEGTTTGHAGRGRRKYRDCTYGIESRDINGRKR